MACQEGHLECIKYLLQYEKEKNLDVKIDKTKKTITYEFNPLLAACNNDRISTINYLLLNVYKNEDNKGDNNSDKMFVLFTFCLLVFVHEKQVV